ncbi:hypothetical protein DY042_05125 [Apilactobacillus kunkeei]|uniref:restriction endonuclease subunit S n=1 Tax=Apilactobacillus kunkeei TaxID=148814 RepID=UPI0011260BBB|nr:restriction endonuclease subunit S [Apilactobacillus kunkeei]TPR50734.1 hypothetical protein DY042_05125 [Apilactobacillus kunkeei]
MPNFKQFKMGDIFQFESVKQSKSQSDIPTDNSEKGIPYIVQSKLNNMFSRNVNRQWLVDHDEKPIPGNKIVLGVTLPALSYQPLEFGASQVILAYSKELNELNGLYLVTVISKQMVQFSYGNKPGLNVYKNMKIPLPVDKKGKIDFDYMEQRIKELECERIKELECERIKELSNYLSATGLDNYKLSEKDNNILGKDINTGKFIIGDLFNKVKLSHKKNFDKRIDTTTTKSKEFNLPLINAKMGNNGIMYYARREDFDSISKTIDIIQNGAIATGMVYVQPQDTGILWDAYLLQAKFDVDQRCKILFYVATSIRKAIKPIFNRERKATWSRVQKQSILLPVDEDGNIDFKYMIDYITAIEKITIKDVVQYKDKVIESTKKVIKKTAI